RMQGYNVLHPMGWDSFGLTIERTAERENIHPAIVTRRNIDRFREQIKRIGFSYDWDREISTSAPDYYRWTQWIFLKLHEKGLAYLDDIPVNWCPALGTVLSNEEVKDGKYVETGDPVEQRLMRQWMLRITAYAERLLDDIEELDWPEGIKEMQRNWIGKSEGAEIEFKIEDSDASFSVFSTRPDTLFGATYCVFAPEHPLVEKLTTEEHRSSVEAYVEEARNKTDLQRTDLAKEKTGVFTGAYAVNPANEEAIPIWVADYVLMAYGTGAIMAVPAQDDRDWEFAEAHDLPIVRTVQPPEDFEGGPYLGDGPAINSDFLNGLSVQAAKSKMIEWLEDQGKGERQVQYRLRDWLFSRQRYWGEPFPTVQLEDGTIMPLPENELPVELPPINEYKPTAGGEPPLARASDDWLMVTLPDGRKGVRETNTMPQWAGSCWYYLRYMDPQNEVEPWSAEAEQYWMPVDLYVGGAEHAVLHLLYARFWHKVLYDCGLVSTKEPFQKLFNQGMILAYSYQDDNGKYYSPKEVEEQDAEWFVKASGVRANTQIEKMSKSRFNIVTTEEAIDAYGADALRLYELFIGPLSVSAPWQTRGVDGVYRFLQRVWRLVIDEETGDLNGKLTDAPIDSDSELWKALNQAIKDVTEDTESIDKMNTAISHMMVFVNAATQAKSAPKDAIKTFLRLLSPYAPHLAEELWERLGEAELIAHTPWPICDVEALKREEVTIVVQVNGKLRGRVQLAADASNEEAEAAALADERVQNHVAGKTVRKVIVVPNRLVNIVV
ncbi:MAG: leucine--tRNA ligase, partial [Candidatus Poribacteria bacterium]|nr:leucine--tRNA ligase [Candidatus Poribacteria bacterium]